MSVFVGVLICLTVVGALVFVGGFPVFFLIVLKQMQDIGTHLSSGSAHGHNDMPDFMGAFHKAAKVMAVQVVAFAVMFAATVLLQVIAGLSIFNWVASHM